MIGLEFIRERIENHDFVYRLARQEGIDCCLDTAEARSDIDALIAEVERLMHPDFLEFVALLDDFLTHYPEDSIVCSEEPTADPGARFTAALRRARAHLRHFEITADLEIKP